ncbi:hypothetical protein Hamer_G019011 [Homarus americanus]|uniref:Uncharacterized protein n=1 Tax=Homarus americanus TaxID=6706 RepID=A0A8J5K132_HOMAM|nr:hypothetical protein Hamer_G019011 [Homarus americanus]
MQDNVGLFGQLYISMQNQAGNHNKFFSKEVHAYSPSLSDFGKLHLPAPKSQLLRSLEKSEQPEVPSSYDGKTMDGAVIVHSLPTASVSTFEEYADTLFIPYLQNQLETASQLEVVWNNYIPNSLKESTREKKGERYSQKGVGSGKNSGQLEGFPSC